MQIGSHELVTTIRGLRHAPGFALVALGTLTIAMAANTIIFSVLNAVARPQLPYRDPARIVSISEAYPPNGWTDVPTSLATLRDLRRHASSFTDVAAHSQRRVSYTDGEQSSMRVQAAIVSANLWTTLGVMPVLGRGFSSADDGAGSSHPMVIGYRLWRDRYGLDPNVLERSAIVDGISRRITGVMADGFRFPEAEDLWLPVGILLEREPRAFETRDARSWGIAARLRTDVTLEQARAELETIAARSAQDHPETNRHWTLAAVLVAQESLMATGPFFGALQAGALLLILVMCGNLGNLLLARGEQRRRELAIRASLGASRARLVWLLMLEAVLVSSAAAGIALLVASWAIRLVPLAIPESIPFYIHFRIDGIVVAFTTLVALGTTVAAGLGSAFRVPKGNLSRVLSGGAATLAGATGAGRLRSAFLFAQTTVAAALLASTLVIALGLAHFQRMDLGFEPANTLLVELPLPAAMFATPDATRTMASEILERVAELPGVRAAAISSPVAFAVPAGGRAIEADTHVQIEGPGTYWSVTPEFFRASGIRVQRGRALTTEDVTGSEPVALLNAEAARRFFGGNDPLGKRIRFGRSVDTRVWRTVVGIVPNTVVQPLDPEIEPQIYVPYDQDPGRLLTITLRSASEPELLARSISHAIQHVDPKLAHEAPISAERRLAVALWPLRFFNGVAGGLAALGVLVAAAGVYGLTRYLTLARTREIGLRLALGASRAAIIRLVASQSGLPVAAGIVTGLAASMVISNLLQHVLAGISAVDPVALGVAACALMGAGALALVTPALRAMRVTPSQALRGE